VVNLPCGVDINNLIDDLRIFSWEAADILLYYSDIIKNSENNTNIISNENETDPVTVADLKVNNLIIRRMQAKYKNIDWEILSEENVKEGKNNLFLKSDWLWVLDPLDGTKDFIQGTEDYAMHLALNYKGNPHLGIVLIPCKDELWFSNGDITWCEGRNRLSKAPKLSKFSSLNQMTLVTTKNHNNKTLKDLIEKIEFKKRIIMGSIGCKIASILRGESDIYISLSLPGKSAPKDWDFAAPEAILISAGGAITNIANQCLNYKNNNFEQRGIIIASSNNQTHELLCNQINEIITENNLYPFFS